MHACSGGGRAGKLPPRCSRREGSALPPPANPLGWRDVIERRAVGERQRREPSASSAVPPHRSGRRPTRTRRARTSRPSTLYPEARAIEHDWHVQPAMMTYPTRRRATMQPSMRLGGGTRSSAIDAEDDLEHDIVGGAARNEHEGAEVGAARTELARVALGRRRRVQELASLAAVRIESPFVWTAAQSTFVETLTTSSVGP